MKERNIPAIDGVTYIAESVIGQGGAGEVLKVKSSVDDKFYALKRIVKRSGAASRNERFRNEIDYGMSARNDHVIRIHGQSEDEDYFFYIMDLYSKNLRDIIAEELDYEVLLDYLSQLCDGLAYVHAQGVVHRDIKPENILVDDVNRRLVIADFGIAHFKDSALTRRSDILANRNYQAPEQMARADAGDIGMPADIFALGLIVTEIFTKQNARGAQHLRVGDVYPFLSDLDPLVEKMTLQDETQRVTIQAVRDSLRLIRRQVISNIEEIVDEMQLIGSVGDPEQIPDVEKILRRAGTDLLSAKYIFERTTDDQLKRYNVNYHCEISYQVSEELYNICVHSELYSMCKAKFEYEANGLWRESDMDLVLSAQKDQLLNELKAIQHRYPLAQNSIWDSLPRLALHYFRFCKEYHCEELLADIKRILSTVGRTERSLHYHLVGVPILWIVKSLRSYLDTDYFKLSPDNLLWIEIERHIRVHWEETAYNDPSRKTVGATLFTDPLDTENNALTLRAFQTRWEVSLWQRGDGKYWVHFPREEYLRFSREARAAATPHSTFEADLNDLLRPEAEYDDLVTLVWDPGFHIYSTLAKVIRLREI